MNEQDGSVRKTSQKSGVFRIGFKKSSDAESRNTVPFLKIALPSNLSPKCGESVYNIVSDKLKTQKVRLLLDASEIRRVDQEGLRWLYEISALMKSRDLPKVVLRKPNRIIRDAMIFSNIMRYFDVIEDVHG